MEWEYFLPSHTCSCISLERGSCHLPVFQLPGAQDQHVPVTVLSPFLYVRHVRRPWPLSRPCQEETDVPTSDYPQSQMGGVAPE